MMKFRVIGADRETGDEVELIVNAGDFHAAEESAIRRGLLVERVLPVETAIEHVEPPTPPPPPPQPPAAEPVDRRREPVWFDDRGAEAGHRRAAPSINVHTPKRASSLGVTAFILAIVALLLCWVPLLGMIAIPIGGLAALLALVGFFVAIGRGGSGIGYPVAGGLVSLIALAIGGTQLGILSAGVGAIGEAGQAYAEEQDRLAREFEPPEGFAEGDIDLTIAEAYVDFVPAEDYSGNRTRSEEQHLVVVVAVENRHTARRLEVYDLQPAITFSADRTATIEDEHGNRYRSIDFGYSSGDPLIPPRRATVDPGQRAELAMVFEQPVDAAERLTLRIPGNRIGHGRGTIVVELAAP